MCILSGLVAFVCKISSGKAFVLGFIAGNVVWLGLSFYCHVTSLSSLAGMIGDIFQGLAVSSLIFITGLLGGITAGLGAWSGAAIRHLNWPLNSNHEN